MNMSYILDEDQYFAFWTKRSFTSSPSLTKAHRYIWNWKQGCDASNAKQISSCQIRPKPEVEGRLGGLLPGPVVYKQPGKPLKAGVLESFHHCNTGKCFTKPGRIVGCVLQSKPCPSWHIQGEFSELDSRHLFHLQQWWLPPKSCQAGTLLPNAHCITASEGNISSVKPTLRCQIFSVQMPKIPLYKIGLFFILPFTSRLTAQQQVN